MHQLHVTKMRQTIIQPDKNQINENTKVTITKLSHSILDYGWDQSKGSLSLKYISYSVTRYIKYYKNIYFIFQPNKHEI